MSTSEAEVPGAPRRGRGRRPAAEVRGEIMQAAAQLLLGEGIAAVTFDRVASVSATSKTTIYKWWPSPGALAAEAYFAHVEHALDFIDTGDIEHDVSVQLEAFARLMTEESAGHAIRELIGAAQTDPLLRKAFVTAYSGPRRNEAIAILRQAQHRGQIREEASLDVIVDQLWGACYHRLLLLDEPLPPALVHTVVDSAFAGARPR